MRRLVLVKHALPILEDGVTPREWRLGPEGEAQARRLAGRLERLLPFRLVASREPKALRTAELVGAELALPVETPDGLEEIDRPAASIVGAEEHERLNARLFAESSRAVVGRESATDALARFSSALTRQLERHHRDNLVAVTHGTVISLFVAAHNDVDAFELWRRLECGSHVVLDIASYTLREVVDV